ncbi:uncharacterized protein DS421_13g413510 [Arachis hypogaea]|nr:uncharacterized protein DS421_13g413510 [Arachis hypogaea]
MGEPQRGEKGREKRGDPREREGAGEGEARRRLGVLLLAPPFVLATAAPCYTPSPPLFRHE